MERTNLQRMMSVLTVAVLIGLWPGSEVRAAGPLYWDWPDRQSFADVELDGAAIDAGGHLMTGLVIERSTLTGQDVVWRVVPDGDDGFYSGTGHTGELYHTDGKGESRLFCQLQGTEIFSLLRLDDGTLLAGCGPEGQLYRIDDEGAATLLGAVEGGYVWSLAVDPESGKIWVTGGSPAVVYELDLGEAEPALKKLIELPAENALDVAPAGGGRLLVATQGPGLIYRLDAGDPERLELLFESPQEEIRQFVTGPDGDLFCLALNQEDPLAMANGQTGRGVPPGQPRNAMMMMMPDNGQDDIARAAIYRIDPEGSVTAWWTGDIDLMIALWSPVYGWLAGGPLSDQGEQAGLLRLTPPAGQARLAGWEGGDILDLVFTGDKGRGSVLIGQAHPGGVTVLGSGGDAPHQALSPTLDAGVKVRWGRLTWQGKKGSGKPRWSVRGGNRAEPDRSWTDWSKAWSGRDEAIDLPPSRYLQWRVELPRGSGDDSWRITSVSVSAWEDNLPPVIAKFVSEQVKQMEYGGLMPSNQNVTQTMRSGLRVEIGKSSRRNRVAEGRRAARARPVHTYSWQGTDPNEDRLLYDLEYRRHGETTWRLILDDTEEPVGSWDTATVPDGDYELRLTVSDARDNPDHLALSSSSRLGPVAVDNTSPKIGGFKVRRTETGFAVSLEAEDATGSLAAARIMLPDGRIERLDPQDLICDSSRESFAASWDWPPAGRAAAGAEALPWLIRVEIEDLAGNLAVAEGEVR